MQTPDVNADVKKVTDIIEVLNSGSAFYGDAIDTIDDQAVKAVFRQQAAEKERAAAALQPWAVREQDAVETGSALSVEIRKHYTAALAALKSDPEHAVIDQLEEVEDKILEAIDAALAEEQPLECLTELRRLRSTMQVSHDRMKALQEATD